MIRTKEDDDKVWVREKMENIKVNKQKERRWSKQHASRDIKKERQ